MEITLKDLWKVLKKSILFVLVGALVLGLVFYIYTATSIPKVYQSTAKYFLSPQSQGTSSSDQMNTADLNNDLVVGSKYIATMSEYLLTEETMEQVLRFVAQWNAQHPDDTAYFLTHEYTKHTLLNAFTFVIPTKDETKLTFEVKCRAASADDARILLSAFSSIINERCSTAVFKGLFVVMNIGEPKTGTQIAPNIMTNTLLGCVIGAVLPYAFFLVLAVLDTRIKSEEDIKNKFKYPVLGQIPHL